MRHLTDEEAEIYESWLEKESMPTDITLSDMHRITRCKGCEYAVIAPLLEAEEPPNTLYCKLMGYPCDMIKICDIGKL